MENWDLSVVGLLALSCHTKLAILPLSDPGTTAPPTTTTTSQTPTTRPDVPEPLEPDTGEQSIKYPCGVNWPFMQFESNGTCDNGSVRMINIPKQQMAPPSCSRRSMEPHAKL